MTKRPETLDEVDWDAASDLLRSSFPDSSIEEVLARVDRAAINLDATGHSQEAEAMRRAAANLRRRKTN